MLGTTHLEQRPCTSAALPCVGLRVGFDSVQYLLGTKHRFQHGNGCCLLASEPEVALLSLQDNTPLSHYDSEASIFSWLFLITHL